MQTVYFHQKVKSLLSENHLAKSEQNKKFLKFIALFFLGVAAVAPNLAMAAPWDSVGSSILAIFTNGLSRTIAIIAVVACGIAAMAGKLSWSWVINIVIGIVLIFGGSTIVDYLIAASS